MNDSSKVKPNHTQRAAIVYIRQSSPAQVENHRESTARQYALVEKAGQLGWAQEQVVVIDEDLGLSGSGWAERSGFGRLTTEVGLGRVGIVLGLEVSRLARNNADWYRLFDLCGVTDTLVGDGDGVYHPALRPKRNCTSCAPGSKEESAIRRPAANCAVPCPWASCGEKRTAKCVFILTNPSSTLSAPSLPSLPNWDRSARSGSGSAPRVFPSPCAST